MIVKPGFDPIPPGLVHTVDGTSNMIWCIMCQVFIWTWANCGGAQVPLVAISTGSVASKCKATYGRTESPVVADELSPADTSAVVSAEEYGAPQVPKMRSTSFDWRQPILLVSFPFPRFAMQPAAPKYPSSLGSRSSTPCLDLAIFESECSGSVSMDSPESAVDLDRDVVDPPELCEVVG